MIALLCLFLSFYSCNKEELFVEQKQEIVEEETPLDEDKETTVDTSLPCDFSLSSITANSTVIINCVLNLEGNTITLPDNVNIQFEGGEINNGVLVFSGGNIAGDLLNIDLEIKGDVTLKTDNFNFYPEKWGIVEGKTTKEIALQNRKHINKAIELVKHLGGTIFELGKIDAYFNVEANKVNREYCSERSIRIPSDFHFKMGDDTFLRVQPNHFPAYALLTTYVTDNSIISGGNLIGDRWEHDYTPINDIAGVNRADHGYGHLIWVIGSHNTVIDNVIVREAIGEGIQIHAETIRNNDGTLKPGKRTSENILIKNSLITECRRNNIAVVDAKGVVIENCDITDCGKGEQAVDANGKKIYSSAGAQPSYGIDIEALRYVNDDGSIREINKIEDVVIRNSRFTGNEKGDIDVYTVTNVLIENNYFDKWVANFASSYVTIRNNTFESRDPSFFAIGIQSYINKKSGELNHHYTIENNTIKNYETGVWVAGYNQKISNNSIINCKTGVLLIAGLKDSTFSGNTITSNLDVSFGYKNLYNCQNINNVTISDETINVKNRPLSLIEILDESKTSSTQITFNNCSFNTENTNFKLHIKAAKNIELKNNTSNTDFEIINSENIILTNNIIN